MRIIIDKYEMLTRKICQNCSKPVTHYTAAGWIGFYCEDCAEKLNQEYGKCRDGKDYCRRIDEYRKN